MELTNKPLVFIFGALAIITIYLLVRLHADYQVKQIGIGMCRTQGVCNHEKK